MQQEKLFVFILALLRTSLCNLNESDGASPSVLTRKNLGENWRSHVFGANISLPSQLSNASSKSALPTQPLTNFKSNNTREGKCKTLLK